MFKKYKIVCIQKKPVYKFIFKKYNNKYTNIKEFYL